MPNLHATHHIGLAPKPTGHLPGMEVTQFKIQLSEVPNEIFYSFFNNCTRGSVI